jgi:riboflavin kinase/FMN adenylyltransferase
MRVSGRVVEGNKVGRELGYPTANIVVDEEPEAESGVYAAVVEFDGQQYGAMANFGVKPTFSKGGDRILELHIFDFEGDLYGRHLRVELGDFIRPEKKFPTPEALRMQIARDEKTIKNILKCT